MDTLGPNKTGAPWTPPPPLGKTALIVGALVSALLSGCAQAPTAPTTAYFQGVVKTHSVPQEREVPQTLNGGRTISTVGSPAPAAALTPDLPAGPTPRFDVLATRDNDRPDGSSGYFAVMDPLNTATDAFKLAVKKVLKALAVNDGDSVFSASIWDDPAAARTEVSYRSNPDLFSEEMMNARTAFNAAHLVATYVGGLAAAGEPPSYVLFWFPESDVSQPNPGRWVSAEVWRP